MIGSNISGGEAHTHNQSMSEINTTPLVDVMLVLLVIFIITAPLLTHAVKIDLPQATSEPLPEKPEVISLAIDALGKTYWNDAPLVKDELKQKLQKRQIENHNQSYKFVLIKKRVTKCWQKSWQMRKIQASPN